MFLGVRLKDGIAKNAPTLRRQVHVDPEPPKEAFGEFLKSAKGECYTRLWPSLSDSTTGTTLSLARKDYDSPLLVFHDSDSDFPGRLAYSSLPEHTVRLLTQRHLGCLHPLSYELA